MDGWTDRQTGRETETDRQRETETGRQRERRTYRHKEIDRHIQTLDRQTKKLTY